MRLRVLARMLQAAGTVLLAAAATPALAQTADVSVSMTPAATTNLSLGATTTYKLKIASPLGAAYVTSFTVDGSVTPAAAPYNGTIRIGAVTASGAAAGCVPTTVVTPPAKPPPLPCKVTLDSPLLGGASTTVSIPATLPIPSPLPTAAADCPSATTVVASTFTVANVMENATVVDTNLTNNTVAQNNPIKQFADLGITNVTAPGNANQGDTLNYSVTIHNYGPCAATTTFSDFVTPASASYVSATGCANAKPPALTDTFAKDGGCDLSAAPFAIASDLTYTTQWTVLNFPKDIIAAAVQVSIDVVADQDVINASGHSGTAAVSTKIDLSGHEGCSTGGAGTLLALLPLLALRFGRRRSS